MNSERQKPRLQQHYESVIRPDLQTEFGIGNPFAVPRLEKIVVNMGVGEGARDAKKIDVAESELAVITGQKPVVTRAKRSVAAFKLREGMPVGVKVTLRLDRMYEFLDRLLTIALPRVRDFRGISSKSFDGHGNYAMGLKEQIVFPEIDYDKVEEIRGMDIIMGTTAETDEQAYRLLSGFDMPFTK